MRRTSSVALVALVALVTLAALGACAPAAPDGPVLRVSTSALGREGELVRAQLARFAAAHLGVRVEEYPAPDAADLRHQLYVQWLGADSSEPDVLALDVVWTAEFAAAGWLLPLERFAPDASDFFPATLEANRFAGELHALPWFVDVGMLYYRSDLVPAPPATFDELVAAARAAKEAGGLDAGLLWQGARYEGLVTVFLEHLGAHGGAILGPDGGVMVDAPEAVAALEAMKRGIVEGWVPSDVLSMHEEETRLAFQNGHAAFLRNWPYCRTLLADPEASAVAGHVGITAMPPAPGGHATAALGGAELAVNARSHHAELAYELVAYLTAPAQMRERALALGQLPARPSLYDEAALWEQMGVPGAEMRRIVEAAVPRPVTPVYTELSQLLQVELHRALTGQKAPRAALEDAARGMRALLKSAALDGAPSATRPRPSVLPLLALGALALSTLTTWLVLRRRRRRALRLGASPHARLAWALVTPALACIALVAAFPLGYTFWESLHHHDLRLPWTGRAFVGGANYAEALGDARFWAALGHTAMFSAITVALELVLGLALALGLHRSFRARGLVRATVLVPWAIPTVVAALVWRFLFQPLGAANQLLAGTGLVAEPVAWFNQPATAWIPVILADVWKTTPFVALLLLAGLQGIDDTLYEAAKVDGATGWQRFYRITLPLLRPTIAVALLFRVLDAFRVFDLIYVLTGGGPGTATEPLAAYTFTTLLQHLRLGFGSALSMLVFAGAFLLSVLFIRFLGADLLRRPGR